MKIILYTYLTIYLLTCKLFLGRVKSTLMFNEIILLPPM